MAAVVSQDGRWPRLSIETLHHLAQIDFLAVDLYDANGKLIFSHPPSAPVQADAAATAPVKVGDERIGTVVVSRDDGRLFTGEEIQLRQELLRMHIVAGVVSAVIAVLVALYLAVTLSRPLRRIRAGADAMIAGDLDARVPESGDDEIAAVADALNRLAETLQQEEGLRKESVADLAHELRTPVQGILARVEAAQDGVLDDEKANLSAMHDEALRLARLLDDLSALAEAERPGLLLDAEPVDLAAIAGSQAAAFSGAFADKGITLSSDLRAGDRRRRPPAARADRREPALERPAVHGRRAARSASASAATAGRRSSRWRTPASGSHPRTSRACSHGSGAARSRARGTRAGPASGSPSSRSWCRRTEARSPLESSPGEGSVFRVTLPLADGAER